MVQLKPTPFEVDIPQVELEELKTLLKLSRLGPETFENKQQDGQFGITRDWLANAKAEWEETFDW
jgi:microsomal epoxide hydrolase